MTRFAWLLPSLLIACGDEAVLPDAGPIIDGPIDGSIDGPSVARCPTAETVLSPTPRWISSVAVLGDRVYVEVRMVDESGNALGGEVLALDPATLGTTSIRTHATAATVAAANGWLYGVDAGASSGEVWRYQPDQPIEVLASGRDRPGPVTSDGTHVYWSDGPQPARQAFRRALAGGNVEPLGSVGLLYTMAVDATHLYLAEFGALRRLPKTGGTPETIPDHGYGPVGIAIDGPDLFRADDRMFVDRITLATGAATVLAQHDVADLHSGLALSPSHVYVTSTAGVERVPRTGGPYERVTSGAAIYDPALHGDVLYWTDSEQLFRCTTN